MNAVIAVIKGDGIGPEIVEQTLNVFDAVERRYGHSFSLTEVLMGGDAIDKTGVPLPDETIKVCKGADAVLLGAVGGPKWDKLPGDRRPEKGLLQLRKGLGLYANLRPAKLFPAVADACPLREDIARGGIDFIVVRELIGGVYFGSHTTESINGKRIATDVMPYSEDEIARIIHTAFKTARLRGSKVTSVDKANVLDTSRLWRAVAEEIAAEYPDVKLEHMLVDNAAMQIVRNPAQFDVMVTENMFGDILSDEASMVTGSIGLIPSASLGEESKEGKGIFGLYEPIHGSAPDIAGQDKANPIGTILSAAMLLRYSLGLETEARAIEKAVDISLEKGLRTADMFSEGSKLVGCREMAEAVSIQIMSMP